MSNSELINVQRARELVEAIQDPASRALIALLVESVVEFHSADSTQLRGSFDLAFLVNVLEEISVDISGLLQGTVPIEYWFEDYPSPTPFDEASDFGPTGFRQQAAFNYAALYPDKKVQATLLTLTTSGQYEATALLPE